MTSRLHDTEKTILQRQTQNKKDPQKKLGLGTVSKKITGGLKSYEQRHEISKNVVCATSKASDQTVHTHSLIRAFASPLNIL